ncbi:hypothetical protein XOCgx_3072 [Xanthomonas oryzae pv. oryzicola]|nr:hypothetical protein XOCgx_3072 [Xanthomonas oryzae pv. oryzicola]
MGQIGQLRPTMTPCFYIESANTPASRLTSSRKQLACEGRQV